MRPQFVSLFTGAGGIDLGLEAAGFEPIVAVEKDPVARSTLASNRPEWALADDGDAFAFVADLTPGRLGLKRGELDLLAGGPPCQPFSKAAQWSDAGRRGMKDDRADCVDAMAEATLRLRPKLVLLENVPGFVTRVGSGLARFRDCLAASRSGRGYTIHQAVLRAEDYGVPQNRRRGFVVAVREDVAGSFAWPDPVVVEERRTANDALAGLAVADPPRASGRWASLLPSIPAGSNYMHLTPEGPGEPLFGARTRFWSFLLKLHPELPSWTLPANPGPATGPFHWENRPLATCEIGRLQTFPADWRWQGSRHAQIRQSGNAAPPLLVELVGRQLLRLLDKRAPRDVIHRLAPTTRKARVPRVRPVPEQFLLLRGQHARHGGTGQGPKPRTRQVG